MLWMAHHLAIDHTTLEMMTQEAQGRSWKKADLLPEPTPFRNFVAQARLGVSREEHGAFFREMLGDVDEPTAPFGLLEARGDGSGVEEGRHGIDGCCPSVARPRALAESERCEPVSPGVGESVGGRVRAG